MRKSISNALQPFRISGTAFFLLVFVVFSCTSKVKPKHKKPVDIRAEFVKKQYDLLPFRGTEYGAVKFRYPEWFEKSYQKEVAFKDNAICLEIPRLSILFTVEEFSPMDFYGSLFENVELIDTSMVENFHYAYLERRLNSLEGLGQPSEVEKIKGSPYPGLISYVSNGSEDEATMYAMASIEIDSKVYQFQFICPRQTMGYVADDFLRILQSVRKR